MSKFRYILVLLLVLLLTIFTRWLLTSVEQPVAPGKPEERHDPDYFISDFSVTVYDDKGSPAYRVKAEHLDHYPDVDILKIKQLQVEYLEKTAQEWIALADQGTAYQNIEVLDLKDNVKVMRNTQQLDKMLTLYADQLRIDFLKRQATTDSKVKIVGKNSKIESIGMRVDLDRGILILTNRARGEYVPQ